MLDDFSAFIKKIKNKLIKNPVSLISLQTDTGDLK